jgi:hypothetical protein
LTELLPTPPLPDEMSSGRVFEPGWLNGMAPSLGVAVRLVLTGGAGGVAVQLQSQRLTLLVGHHGEVERDGLHVGQRADRGGDAVLDLVAAAGTLPTVSATSALTEPPSTMTLRTMPRSTIERRSSGSSTGRRASMT